MKQAAENWRHVASRQDWTLFLQVGVQELSRSVSVNAILGISRREERSTSRPPSALIHGGFAQPYSTRRSFPHGQLNKREIPVRKTVSYNVNTLLSKRREGRLWTVHANACGRTLPREPKTRNRGRQAPRHQDWRRPRPQRTALTAQLHLHVQKTREPLLHLEANTQSNEAQTRAARLRGQELATELASAEGTSCAAGSQPVRPELMEAT